MPITLNPISPGPLLVDNTRAVQNGTLAALNTSNPAALTSLLTAASKKIQRYCRRDFLLTTYAEYYDGNGYPYQEIQLRQFPVISLARLATTPQAVLSVANTSVANQRATVATTATGLTLYRMASGVPTTSALLYTTYPTITLLAAAVTALGNGWTGTAAAGYTLHPSADLRPVQGAIDTISSPGCLELYTEELQSWGAAMVNSSLYGNSPGWRLQADTGQIWGCFPQGIQNIRIDYTAGFAGVPDEVQEACVLFAQDMYQAEQANRAQRSGSLGPYRFEYAADQTAMSKAVRSLLSDYVDHAKGLLY